MMFLIVMFCAIIGNIYIDRDPVNYKVFLRDTIVNPIKLYINGFGTFLFGGVIFNAACNGVIRNDGSC